MCAANHTSTACRELSAPLSSTWEAHGLVPDASLLVAIFVVNDGVFKARDEEVRLAVMDRRPVPAIVDPERPQRIEMVRVGSILLSVQRRALQIATFAFSDKLATFAKEEGSVSTLGCFR